MFAVIETGGKQYKVAVGDEILVEKLDKEAGATLEFDALLVEDGKKVKVGTPVVKDIKVNAEVVEHGKGDKIIIFKYISKKRHKSKNGHRQPFTKIKITQIG